MTKDIDLYAIGNGLVDIQFQVSDSDIEELGLPKGEMRQSGFDSDRILEKFNNSHNRNICSGGSAANSVIAFAGFGGKACYTTALGDDKFGRFYKQEFDNFGIELNSRLSKEEPTGKCIVLISPDSERTMNTVLGANKLLSPDYINDDWVRRSKWIYLEGYELTGETNTKAFLKAIEIAKSSGTLISTTFSDAFIINQYPDRIKEIASLSDLAFCNEKEAMLFTGSNDFDTAFDLIAEKVPNVVITCGSKGSRIKFGGEIVDIQPYPAKAIDTTGAGDMFAGAFLYGITHKLSLQDAGNLASLASSIIVSQFGARLARSEYNLIKHRILRTVLG